MTKRDITKETWESYVQDNGAVYVTDESGQTICDLHYVTDKVERSTGKRLVHTFPDAEKLVKYIVAIPEMLRQLEEARNGLWEHSFYEGEKLSKFLNKLEGDSNEL